MRKNSNTVRSMSNWVQTRYGNQRICLISGNECADGHRRFPADARNRRGDIDRLIVAHPPAALATAHYYHSPGARGVNRRYPEVGLKAQRCPAVKGACGGALRRIFTKVYGVYSAPLCRTN